MLGALTPQEAAGRGFFGRPAVRAASIVRLLTDTDPTVHQTIRVAITGQTTKQRITNKFKLKIAAALILRAVNGTDEHQKVSDIYRALQTGFSDTLASEKWKASYRPTEDVVEEALRSLAAGTENSPASFELAARAAYPLVVSRQLLPDRGTKNNTQVNQRRSQRRHRSDANRTNGAYRQLGRALLDHEAGRPISAVSVDGSPLRNDGDSEHLVTGKLAENDVPSSRPSCGARSAGHRSQKYLQEALAKLGEAMDDVDRAVRRLVAVEGVDGRPLIDTEGVDPADADAWMADVMKLMQHIPVWRNTHVSRHDAASSTHWRIQFGTPTQTRTPMPRTTTTDPTMDGRTRSDRRDRPDGMRLR